MLPDGQEFLRRLAYSGSRFEANFSKLATGVGLGIELNRAELELLKQAALLSSLCNISFNGLGGCLGQIRAEREIHRVHLERSFMRACDAFFQTCGWKKLTDSLRNSVRQTFLRVLVLADNLAW